LLLLCTSLQAPRPHPIHPVSNTPNTSSAASLASGFPFLY
jgi:hypothetical protein